jgi:wyosine [tRNA(Phe)-imidazoG37] synthetase (radical SAM superfamily)
VKLDAATDETFRRINRPVEGVTLSGIVRAVSEFKDHYPGRLGIQVMFTQANLKDADRLAELVNRIQPHEVQLNTPTRPYPRQWVLQTRGSHDGVDYPATPLKPISRQQAREVERTLRELTNLSIVSVYGAEE